MAIQWFALHISLWCCPLRIWRATCWRWGSSAGGVRGCKEPWSGPAAPWLVSLKPSVPPPPRPVRPRRVPSPHPQSPPCWERTRLQTEPFYKRDEETAWLRVFNYRTTFYQRKMRTKRKIKGSTCNPQTFRAPRIPQKLQISITPYPQEQKGLCYSSVSSVHLMPIHVHELQNLTLSHLFNSAFLIALTNF